MLKISIIIATYNRSEILKGGLNSLLNQDCDGTFDHEIIVVDNNSEDKTKKMVEEYLPRFNGKLKYLFEPRQGKSYALNRAIKEAKGEILAFTDDDVIVKEDWLKKMSNIFRNNKKVECATGRVLPIWKTEKPIWYSDKVKGVIVHVDYGEERKEVGYCVGSNAVFKKTVFEKYGGYETENRLQDVQFARKIEGHVKIHYFPELIVHHHAHENRLNKAYFKQWYAHAGRFEAELVHAKGVKDRTFLNVELWRYKEFLSNILQYMLNFFNLKESFYYQMRLIFFVSFFKEMAAIKKQGSKK